MTTAPLTIDIARDRAFILSFDPQNESREAIRLGVVPIGAIEINGYGRWQWVLYLPVIERMHRAGSIEEARERVRGIVRDWLEAATEPPRSDCRTSPRRAVR